MSTSNQPKDDLPQQPFEQPQEWEAWLAANHADSPGIWLKLAKKNSGIQSINYDEALEEALCYGWIDSQKKGYDDQWWLQKFTPRRSRSKWSKRNREIVAELIADGRMQPAGQQAIDQAKQNGEWDAAYDTASRAIVPPELQAALDNNPAAQAFFDTLDSRNRYAVLYRIQTAKRPATRQKHIDQLVAMLENEEKLYP